METTKENVQKAHDAGCKDVKRTLEMLFPEAFPKRERLAVGVHVVGYLAPGITYKGTVIGHGDSPRALAFYKSTRGCALDSSCHNAECVLVLHTDGTVGFNEDNGFYRPEGVPK